MSINLVAHAEITKEQYYRVSQTIRAAYEPVFSEQGLELVVTDEWNGSYEDGNSSSEGKKRGVHIYGGLARLQGLTEDALMFFFCHEIGHHLGGTPQMVVAGQIFSNEGQADYYATQTCLKKVWPEATGTRLQKVSLIAAKALAAVMGEKGPSAKTPDRRVVKETLSAHPNTQCRLDTMLAGIENQSRPRCWFAN